MRRWQYSKAFSRRRSGGGRRPVEEAADSTDRVEPSCSDLSSGERTVALGAEAQTPELPVPGVSPAARPALGPLSAEAPALGSPS